MEEKVASEFAVVEAGEPQSLNLLGVSLAQSGRRADAILKFYEAIQLDPNLPQAHHNLGTALAEENRLEEAIATFRRAVELAPTYLQARRGLAISLRNLNRRDEAVRVMREHLHLAPDDPDVLHDLGMLLSELRRPSEAAVLHKHALRLKPNWADAHNGLGLAQLAAGRYAEAEASFEAAVRLDPKFSSAQNNLATAYKEQGRIEEALAQYDLAVRIDPEAPSIRWNRAIALLQAGDHQRGWIEYEWRFRRPATPMRPFQQPLWDGSELHGRTILIHPEQGLGDAIQFARYIPLIKARGGRVILECPSPLAAVLSTCSGIDEMVTEGQQPPAFDVHLPVMSAPRVFQTTLATVPAETPYLHVDPLRQEHWHSIIAGHSAGRMKIGIAWQGNPHHQLDQFRSIALEQFRPISQVPGVALFSLQRGPGTEQLDRFGSQLGVIELTDRAVTTPNDWADAAAIMKCLDLVITVDTATAHLAGALGVPVWILLSSSPDWRWLTKRSDSPWYPTARLFRQKTLDDWETVMHRAAGDLTHLLRDATEKARS